jgi:hypothetical protein
VCVCVCVRVVMLLLVNHFATRVVDIWCWLSAIAVLVVGHIYTCQSLPLSLSISPSLARARSLSLSRALSLSVSYFDGCNCVCVSVPVFGREAAVYRLVSGIDIYFSARIEFY